MTPLPLPLAQPRILSDISQSCILTDAGHVLSNPDAYADSPTLIHMAQLCVMSAGGMPATQRNCNRDRSDLSEWQRYLIAKAAKDERARLAALRSASAQNDRRIAHQNDGRIAHQNDGRIAHPTGSCA